MSIFIGNSELKECYVGSTPVKEIYAGSTLVWPTYPINDPQPYFAKIWVPDTSMEHWISSPSRYQGFSDWSYSFYNTQGGMEARYNQLIIVDGPWFRENCSYSDSLGYYVNLTGDIGISSTLTSVSYQQQELLNPYSFVKDMPAMSDSAAWKSWSETKCNKNYIESYVSLDAAYSYGAASSTITLSTKLYNTQQPVYVWYLRPVTYSGRYQCGPATNCKITGLTLATDKWWDQEYNPKPDLPSYFPYSTCFVPFDTATNNQPYWGWSPAAGCVDKLISGNNYMHWASLVTLPNTIFQYGTQFVLNLFQDYSTNRGYNPAPIYVFVLTSFTSSSDGLIQSFSSQQQWIEWSIGKQMTAQRFLQQGLTAGVAINPLSNGSHVYYSIPISELLGTLPSVSSTYCVFGISHQQILNRMRWSGGCSPSAGIPEYATLTVDGTEVPAHWSALFGQNCIFQG